MKYGTAIQSGNQIIISNEQGSVTRAFDGRLISYIDGTLTYIPTNGSRCSMYIGL